MHSPAERRAAAAAAAAIFGRDDLGALPEATVRAVVAELGTPPLRVGDELPTVVEVLAAAGVVQRSPTPTRVSLPRICCTVSTSSCAGDARQWGLSRSRTDDTRGRSG